MQGAPHSSDAPPFPPSEQTLLSPAILSGQPPPSLSPLHSSMGDPRVQPCEALGAHFRVQCQAQGRFYLHMLINKSAPPSGRILGAEQEALASSLRGQRPLPTAWSDTQSPTAC